MVGPDRGRGIGPVDGSDDGTARCRFPAPGPASHRVALRGTLAPARERAHPAGTVAGTSHVRFDLLLSLRNAAAAQAFVRQVSTPGSAEFHHYLTDAQWLSRFGPTQATVAKAQAWLRQTGFTVGSLAKDRLYVTATGTALRVEHAFGVKLGYYEVNGHKVRLANGTMTIPSSTRGRRLRHGGRQPVRGHARPGADGPRHGRAGRQPRPGTAAPRGVPQSRSRARRSGGRRPTPRTRAQLYQPVHPPAALRHLRLQAARCAAPTGWLARWPRATTASASTIAITDAYDSPTLLADAQQYFSSTTPRTR